MKKSSILLVISFILLTFSTAYAQGNDGKGKHKKHTSKKEIKKYMKENVFPVLREQRAKLETEITTEDKTQINLYRAELKKNRQLIKEGHKKKKEAKKSKQELSQKEKEAIWIGEGERKEVFHKARIVSKNYRESIKKLSDEIAQQKATWEKDIKAIREKNNAKNTQNNKAGNKNRQHGRISKMMRPARFLLLDPKGSDDDIQDVFDAH